MKTRTTLRAFNSGLALLAGLTLATHAGSAQAQATKTKKAEAPAKPTVESLTRKALDELGQENYAAGIPPLEEAAQLDPQDRKPVFLLSMVSSLAADKAKVDPDRLALLRKSAAAFGKLQKMGKELTPEEAEFGNQAQINDVRILALDGKPKPALDAIVSLVSQGFDDLDSLDKLPELKPVLALKEYQPAIEKAMKAGIKASIAATKPFPFDFNLKDFNGKPVKLADFKGSVTIVDVWGTWCPPCREEIPHFVDLLGKYGSKGLKIVGINCNEEGTPAETKKLIADFKITYPCVVNDEKTEEKIPDFQGYPTTLFLDRTGKVRLVLVGYTPMARLETIVTTLLAEPKS